MGADATADGRTVFSLYVPNVKGGLCKVTDSLLIGGTHGLVVCGNGALTRRDRRFRNEHEGYEATATIRWFAAEPKPAFWVKGGIGRPSNPNFQITLRDLTISGHRTWLSPEAPHRPLWRCRGSNLVIPRANRTTRSAAEPSWRSWPVSA